MFDVADRGPNSQRQREMAYWRDAQLDNDQRILRKRARELEQLISIIDSAEQRDPELRDQIYSNLAAIRQQHRGIQDIRNERQQARRPAPGGANGISRAEQQLIRNMPLFVAQAAIGSVEEEEEEAGLSKEELQELPVYEFKPSGDPDNVKNEDKQCSICMSEFMQAV